MGALINIEREYKGVKYEIKGYIKYRTPYGSYIDIENKICLNDNLFRLYKEYPLDYMEVNHILGYKVRPCTTKVIIVDYDKNIDGNEYNSAIITLIAFIYMLILITFCDKFERSVFFAKFYRLKVILYILIIYWMIRLALVL